MLFTQENAADLHSGVASFNTRDYGRGEINTPHLKYIFLSLYDVLSSGHHLLCVSFITNLK